MANTTAMCTSFKKEVFQAVHSFCQDAGPTNVTPARTLGATDTFKGALILASGTHGAGDTNYSGLGADEVSGTGYTAGGNALTIAAGQCITNSTSGVVTPSASLTWSGLTLATAFDSLMIYNSSQGDRAVSIHNFGSQTISAGTLTLTMPANTAGSALLEIA